MSSKQNRATIFTRPATLLALGGGQRPHKDANLSGRIAGLSARIDMIRRRAVSWLSDDQWAALIASCDGGHDDLIVNSLAPMGSDRNIGLATMLPHLAVEAAVKAGNVERAVGSELVEKLKEMSDVDLLIIDEIISQYYFSHPMYGPAVREFVGGPRQDGTGNKTTTGGRRKKGTGSDRLINVPVLD